MKKLVLALMLVLGLAVSASAATKTFKHFSMDVPAGWTASEDGDTAIVVADDKSAALSVTKEGTDGMSAKDLAAAYSKELKGTTPTQDGEAFMFNFKNAAGVDSKCILMVEGKEYALFVLTGESDKFGPMLQSIKEK